MATFYDPIRLEDVDIDDEAAHFYIIRVDENRFKLYASTLNLDSPLLQGGDPLTRNKQYWPITKAQLLYADMDIVFPDEKLRSEPFSLDELNAALKLYPPFTPSLTPQMTFGEQEAAQPALLESGTLLSLQNLAVINFPLSLTPQRPLTQQQEFLFHPNLLSVPPVLFGSGALLSLHNLAGVKDELLEIILKPECMQALQAQPPIFTIHDLSNFSKDDINQILKPECIQAMQAQPPVFTIHDLADISCIEFILKPGCLNALQAHPPVFTIQDLQGLSEYVLNQILRPECIDALQAYPPIFTIHQLKNLSARLIEEILKPECIDALRDGQISIEYISTLNASELRNLIHHQTKFKF